MFHSSKFHLDQVHESYSQHLRAALGIAFRLAAASAACGLHAIIPGLCTRSASRRVAQVHARLANRADSFDRMRADLAPLGRRPPRHVDIESS
jgi:hypothetical protein